MPNKERFRTAMEILSRASEHYGVRSGQAQTLPLPIKNGEAIHCVVLFYREGVRQDEEVLYPPYYIVKLDAESGDIVESKDCAPNDFGVRQEPDVAIEGFGLDPKLSPREFWASFDRFLEISSSLWEIYARGSTTLSSQEADLVLDYNTMYRRVSKGPLIPYYEAVAPDFHDWLGKVLA